MSSVVIGDVRGKNAETKIFKKIQGVVIGNRIKDLKVQTTDHTRKGSHVMAITTNFGVNILLVLLRKTQEKTRTEHYTIPSFTAFILESFTRFKKLCQALSKPLDILIIATSN